MRLQSVRHDGRDLLVEVLGDEVLPIGDLTEIGPDSTIEAVRGAERDLSRLIPAAEVEIRPLVPRAGKVFCVGLNYLSHVEETKRDLPEYPVLFPKYASSFIPSNGDIQLPPESTQVDYEAELAVIIGRSGRRIAEADANAHILGYAVANDVTMRDFQYKTHQWMQGKAWDNSTPMGPTLVTPEEVDVSDLRITTRLNGETLQDSRTSKLMFSIPRLIAVVSEFTTLNPGDVILTGTPGGVGFRRDPQVFLRDGDVIEVEVEGVGALANRVVAEKV